MNEQEIKTLAELLAEKIRPHKAAETKCEKHDDFERAVHQIRAEQKRQKEQIKWMCKGFKKLETQTESGFEKLGNKLSELSESILKDKVERAKAKAAEVKEEKKEKHEVMKTKIAQMIAGASIVVTIIFQLLNWWKP